VKKKLSIWFTRLYICIMILCIAALVGVIMYGVGGRMIVSAFTAPAPTPTPRPTPTPPTVSSTAYYPYDGFTEHTFTASQGSLPYYLYIPKGYNPHRKYPLVLILDGSGERSRPTYTDAQNEYVILTNDYVNIWSGDYQGKWNPDIQQHWPSFIVVPQLTIKQGWVNIPSFHIGSYKQPAQVATPLLLAKELLDSLQRQFTGIDANRLYVTGVSMGAFGVWDALERWPNYFAAAVPIAGSGDPSKAALLKNVAIWDFHGSNDPTVPVSGSRDMYAAIKAAGGHSRYTELKGAPHQIWPFVYYYYLPGVKYHWHVTGLYSWLFAQHKEPAL
jgi:predicted peptidase